MHPLLFSSSYLSIYLSFSSQNSLSTLHPFTHMDMPHITKREGRITCTISPNNLLCLVEQRIDLVNLFLNDFSLYEDIHSQEWEIFFSRLKGPTYPTLVKEFWKTAECDRGHIVSHVCGKRIIITEKTIGELLCLDHNKGIRIRGRNEKDDFISNAINKEIFTDFDPSKPPSEYKSISLVPKLRIWYQILITCINPKPLNLLSENLNADQKYFLHHIKNKDKLFLPAILFQHLKTSIQDSRTTADNDKEKILYIPFGRIISEVLVKNGVIEFLKNEAQTSFDLTPVSGDTLNANNLKSMGILKEILLEPTPEADERIINKRSTSSLITYERRKKRSRCSEGDTSGEKKEEES